MGYRCRGFTLLELMIVIVVVGVLLGMVSFVGGGSPAREVRQEAEAMVQVIHQLRERAVFEGQEYGLRLGTDCLLYTSPSPRDRTRSRMPSSA